MSNKQSLFKLSSYIPPSQTDIVEGFLFEHAPSNWALEVNHLTLEGTLNGFFSNKAKRDQARVLIERTIGALVEFQFSEDEMHDEDWKESYKNHFSPWSYKGIHFIPIWLKNELHVPNNEKSLFLDPGMAFGTGIHESTRMCLEFLIEDKNCQPNPNNLLDIGCGSGILSLLSVLIGFQQVVGIDNDEDAVRISKENASLNNLKGKIAFNKLDLFDLKQPIGNFDCVVANIQADILISNADKIIINAHNDSTIILSGILTNESHQVLDVYMQKGKFKPSDYHIKTMGEWSSILFRRT